VATQVSAGRLPIAVLTRLQRLDYPPGLALEAVIEVGVLPAQGGPGACRCVCWQEQGAEPFVLPDVDTFVSARLIESIGIPSEGRRDRASWARRRR
jgi:hypothetical protein